MELSCQGYIWDAKVVKKVNLKRDISNFIDGSKVKVIALMTLSFYPKDELIRVYNLEIYKILSRTMVVVNGVVSIGVLLALNRNI